MLATSAQPSGVCRGGFAAHASHAHCPPPAVLRSRRASCHLQRRSALPEDACNVQPESTGSPGSGRHKPRAHQARQQHTDSPSGFSRRHLIATTSAAAALAPLTAKAGSPAPAPPTSTANNTIGFESNVAEFTLPNGLHFIVLRRTVAPVVSCHTFANVGAFDETDGQTGLAHLLEHMAFKGTPRIGTRDYKSELPLLDACDDAFYALRDAKAAGNGEFLLPRYP